MSTISNKSTDPQPDCEQLLDWLDSIDESTPRPRRHHSLCEPMLLVAALAMGPDASKPPQAGEQNHAVVPSTSPDGSSWGW